MLTYDLFQQTFQLRSNVFLSWYDVATSHSAKWMLKQRCARQVETYNVEQRRINIVHFNVDFNNVRQFRNIVVIFNVDFYNVRQGWNNVVNMTIWKKIKN